MLQILLLILPIYLLIATGFVAVATALVAAADLRRVQAVVVTLFLPLVMFFAIAANPLAQTFSAGFVAVYAAAGLAVNALAQVAARLAGRDRKAAAVEGLGASCPNSAFVALPVAMLVLGPDVALHGFALAVLVENLLLLPVALALAGGGGVRSFLRNLLRNPLLIAAVAGLAWWGLAPALPVPVEQYLRMVTTATAPVVLVCIGGTLVGTRMAANALPALRVAVAKLLVHPLLAVLLLPLLGGGLGDSLRVAVVLYAAAPMLGVYSIFAARFGHEPMAVTAQIVATFGSALTIPAVLWLIGS